MSTPSDSTPLLTGLIYADGAAAARVLQRLAHALKADAYACAGFVQHDEPCPGRSRCDMILENLATGERVRISEDRGPEARGCILDADVLLSAMTTVRDALPSGADVLLLNKFGKSEAEGGGFRPLIADAVQREIPLVIGVPRRNLASWREFAGDLASEIAVEDVADLDEAALLVRFAGRLRGRQVPCA